jgi:hypothetical protein
MPRYLISFDDGSMSFPAEDLPQVSRDSHAVVAEAKAAGVWIFGGGIDGPEVNVVDTDGTVRRNPYPSDKPIIGGFSIIEVPSHEDALGWAAKMAVACRCAQDVREIMYDPES